MSKLSDAQAISVLILKWVLAQIKLNSVWDLRHRDYQCYRRFYANIFFKESTCNCLYNFQIKEKGLQQTNKFYLLSFLQEW